MCHHGNPKMGEMVGQIDRVRPAFELDRVRAGLLQHAAGVANGLALVDADREKWHVGDDKRLLAPASDRGGPAFDILDGDG